MSQVTLHQEIITLRNHILQARKELQELMHEHHHMKENEKNTLHIQYDTYFKELEIELQNKALQNSELQRRAELLMMKHQRGEKLTAELIALIHKMVDKEFSAIKTRMRDLLSQQPKKNSGKQELAIQESIPKLYKELAKRLHPDMGAEPELTQKYWSAVQTAYDGKDIHTLHALHTLICDSALPDIKEETSSNKEELEKELAKLQSLIEKEKNDITQLKTQIPFCYALGLQDASWIANHGAKLKQQIDKYASEIHKSQEIIRMLTGEVWEIDQDALEVIDPSIKEKREYTEEFIDATYFSGRH
jgi:hypothetical protein